MDHKLAGFEGKSARLQYRVLMALYRIAVLNRWLYGIFCRALAHWFSPANAALVDLGQGAPFRVHLNDGYWTRFLLFHEDYEPEVARLLNAAVGQTPLFCDLGANKGLWTVYGSGLFEQVIAVEAAAETFDVLKSNAGSLENVTLHKKAVFASSGDMLRLVNVENSHASAHLSLSGNATGNENVQTISVDDLVPEGTAALVKLDVEGAEIEAFRGAERAISDGAVLIYEDHGSDTESQNSAYLRDVGLQIYAMETGLVRIETLDRLSAIKTDRFKGYNFLAARADSELLRQIVAGFE